MIKKKNKTNRVQKECAISEIKKIGGRVEIDPNIQNKQIVEVDLTESTVSDETLKHIKGLENLKKLGLSFTTVTDAGLENIIELEQLVELYLAGTGITGTGLKHIKGLKKLKLLDFWGSMITDAGLEHLKGLKQLRVLIWINTPVTDVGLSYIKDLKKLEKLSLSNTKITDLGMKHLRGLTKLQFLDLADTNLTDAGLKHLKGLTRLRRLNLWKTKVTDAGLVHLAGLFRLRWLHLAGTKVTEQGVFKLKEAVPLCHVRIPNKENVMDFYTAVDILRQIRATKLTDLRDYLIEHAIRYARIRVDYHLASAQQQSLLGSDRSLCHNAFISSCDILARNMAQHGEDAAWRDQLSNDRKIIGDFACYLHTILGIEAR